jgi:two-component system chemotaxis response regulator CheY
MKTLIVEDEFTSRLILQAFLDGLSSVHVAVNGKEAVAAVTLALDAGEPYDLIVMDIVMPEMNGQEALQHIRKLEASRKILSRQGAKIVMTTAMRDIKSMTTAFGALCDAYLVKPVDHAELLATLRKLSLIN